MQNIYSRLGNRKILIVMVEKLTYKQNVIYGGILT